MSVFHNLPRYDELGPERRFVLLYELLLADAIAATRDYRRRELHRGRNACRASSLCDECTEDVQLCVMQVFQYYEGARERDRRTKLRGVIDAVIDRAGGGAADVSPGLLRTLLSNAGKDVRMKMATGADRDAKPTTALRTRAAFAPIRQNPLELEVLTMVVQFACSNTPLGPGVLPFGKFAERLAEHAAELGVDPAQVSVSSLPQLIERALDRAAAIDPDWVRNNVTGPLSERMTEFVATDAGDRLECADGPDGEGHAFWGAA